MTTTPRHDDDKGDWDKDHVRDHSAALAHQHVKRAAHAAFAVFQERPFDHLIIAAPEDLSYEGGRLRVGDFVIDLLYKRVLTSELLAKPEARITTFVSSNCRSTWPCLKPSRSRTRS